MRPTMNQLLARLSANGLDEPGHALRIASATAQALGELLPAAEARALYSALPPELASPLADRHEADVEAAIRTFVELFPIDLVARLRARLPTHVGAWLHPGPRVEEPVRSVRLVRPLHDRQPSGSEG